MRTSEIRKLALKLAYELYEGAGGNLNFQEFHIDQELNKFSDIDKSALDRICFYLVSVRVMEYVGLGMPHFLRFTNLGISMVEGSINNPMNSIGPFPPLSIVVGDVGAGAQVAIGSGSFVQNRNDSQNADGLPELVPLLQAAISEMATIGRDQEQKLLWAAESEATNTEEPVRNFV